MRVALVAALLAPAACGAGERDSGGPEDEAGRSEPEETVYQGVLTVLENEEHGPQLTAVVAQSYPPQGGGMDVEGWDWGVVEHEEASGTRWGLYLVTGVFDGEALELTEEPVPAEEIDVSERPGPAEPEIPEPAEQLTEAELQEIVADLAERFPALVNGGRPDADHGVALIDATLVTPEMESYASETHPEGTVVFTPVMRPVN
jgi:hypothetical protein